MHPRNRYKHNKPSFKKLAMKYDFFNAVSSLDDAGRVTIDFKNPAHLVALTKALLHSDFALNVELPIDRLVPTIPLRLNYLLWIEDIFKSMRRHFLPALRIQRSQVNRRSPFWILELARRVYIHCWG